jgi:hypothetical protein
MLQKIEIVTQVSVADPHHLDADPDPTDTFY